MSISFGKLVTNFLQDGDVNLARKIKELGKKLLYCPECGKYVWGMVYENVLTEENYWHCVNHHKNIVLKDSELDHG